MSFSVGIIDDHMIVRDGVRAMAERDQELVITAEAGDAESGITALEADPPDVLLLDLRLGSDNSFELCREITQRYPQVRVVMFTAFGNPELLARSIQAGATGYVLKDTHTARLPAILRTVKSEGSYFDPRLASQTLVATVGSPGQRQAKVVLQDRDVAIIRAIARGKTNSEIGDELHLSPHTVKFCVTSLLRQFDVHRRSELVRLASERQLI